MSEKHRVLSEKHRKTESKLDDRQPYRPTRYSVQHLLFSSLRGGTHLLYSLTKCCLNSGAAPLLNVGKTLLITAYEIKIIC